MLVTRFDSPFGISLIHVLLIPVPHLHLPRQNGAKSKSKTSKRGPRRIQ